MSERAMLFVDYQNAYRGARACFHPEADTPHIAGQIYPVLLAEHIIATDSFDRELSGVRIYRGVPEATRPAWTRCMHPADRDMGSESAGDGDHPSAPLPTRVAGPMSTWGKATGKGIDVALAIDFVRLALEDQYDVGILMSTDTDLKPALETVTRFTKKRVEVAAWSGRAGYNQRLSIDGTQLWCHWLHRHVYEQVCDTTNYSRP